MLYMKVKGLFTGLPKESLTLEQLCKFTNSSKEIVQPEIDRLLKEGFITGKRKYRLKKVPNYVSSIPKR